MKKQGILILSILFICILLFILFTKADNNSLSKEKALEIGEDKYLKFLWMVDGAFNDKRMNGEYIVNGKKLDKNNITFTCNYSKNNNETCVGSNFIEEFNNLFKEELKYEDVYGDKLTYTWIKYEKDKYYFTNPKNCSVNRMNLEQKLSVKEITNDKIVYNISYQGSYNHINNYNFILIKEDNDWKIDEAYYIDLCEMEYHIE